ncbi:hypothetical protein SAMN05920897_109128 [Alkalispirochaeta americana]|uniref:MrpA C-terminal/MbhE domain-containing protein n=1 Tax=Alkalispirochaeta americana TaxID=159291 RepID=A0A1N6T5U2_9SPIO|nr:hydrogen gas-evolving membrane-bound hydrogenase subunit E [Alkalispirochaeta americana]SIQ48775.1 hypothetical protein SAMN05920897_109128 [Alkalispirochaeta americana]
MREVARHLLVLTLVGLLGWVLLGALVPSPGEEAVGAGRAGFLTASEEETGAINVVSAIYLAFRAYDTMGEAIVLMLAVAGVSFFAGSGSGGKK